MSYWAALLVFVVGGARGVYNVLRGGPRRWVYGINSKYVFKKYLRGERDPLWNATRAPADVSLSEDLDFGGVDERWDLAEFTVHREAESVLLRDIKPILRDGKPVLIDGKELHLETRFKRTDFDDERVFEGFAAALKPQA